MEFKFPKDAVVTASVCYEGYPAPVMRRSTYDGDLIGFCEWISHISYFDYEENEFDDFDNFIEYNDLSEDFQVDRFIRRVVDKLLEENGDGVEYIIELTINGEKVIDEVQET